MIDPASVVTAWERRRDGFAAMLDLRLDRVAPGEIAMRMPFDERLLNAARTVHGGAIAALCDAAFWVALASVYGVEQPTATISLTCNFLRPATSPHDLVAAARVIRGGKRIVYGEVNVSSGDALVAHATLSFLNSERVDSERVASGDPAAR